MLTHLGEPNLREFFFFKCTCETCSDVQGDGASFSRTTQGWNLHAVGWVWQQTIDGEGGNISWYNTTRFFSCCEHTGWRSITLLFGGTLGLEKKIKNIYFQSVLAVWAAPGDLITRCPGGSGPCETYPLRCDVYNSKSRHRSSMRVSPSRQRHHLPDILSNDNCYTNDQVPIWLKTVNGKGPGLGAQKTRLLYPCCKKRNTTHTRK